MIDPELAQTIIESASDFAVVSLDERGVVGSWNPGAERVLGWTAADAVGRSADMIFTPEDRAADVPRLEMQQALAEGRAIDERYHLRADGSRFWGSGLLMPLANGGFVKFVRDRTVEREAERRFVTLTDALPGFVFEADADGAYVQANRRYQDFTGRTEAELLGNRWLEAVHPDHRERAARAWARAVGEGEPFEHRLLVRSGAGDYRCFACRGIAERDDAGRVRRWIGTCIDVEEEARARAALEGLNRSLEHAVDEQTAQLADTLQTLRDAAAERERVEEALRQSQKMEAIGQLTGGVAHDFNNLLTVILGSIDLLQRPALPEAKRLAYLASIRETAERAAKLTSQLLAFARRQPLATQSFDVAERLREQQAMLRTLLGPRVRIDTEVRCAPCLVEADPNQFDTAVLNMAVNARDAMNGVGVLTVTVSETDGVPPVRGHARVEGRFVAVAIRDTGTGIAEADRARIFEPFFTTKEVGKGTGLGLSQVFGFAKQSGGEILIDSGPDGGATFTLFLPRTAGRRSVAPVEPETPPDAAAPDRSGCVLLVEDNQMVGEFASELVRELGYGNVWVAGAQEALARLDAEPARFDIVFTDVVMPGMSGIELAETIRERFPDLPVVLTSGYSHILAAEGSHGFELLQKPYTAEGLMHALRRAKAS